MHATTPLPFLTRRFCRFDVAGKDRVRFSCDFYGGMRDEDHSLRLRRPPGSLSPQRLESAGFHDSRYRVSTSTLKNLHV